MEKIKEQYEEMLEDKMKRTQTCKGGEKDWKKNKNKKLKIQEKE
jgi:hypothetical protein